jgi:Reverse transcriptase-like
MRQVVLRHMTGEYQCRSPGLQPYHAQALQLEQELNCQVDYQHVWRENNAEADALANQALDMRNDWHKWEAIVMARRDQARRYY